MTTTISVINQKGGEKNYNVINLAASRPLCQTNLVIDLDPQGNATQDLQSNSDEDKNIYNLLIKKLIFEKQFKN